MNIDFANLQYTVRVNNRDTLQAKLKDNDIPTVVHYPMPLHLQECFQYLNYKQGNFPIAERTWKEVMSLTMNPFLTSSEIYKICNSIWWTTSKLLSLIGREDFLFTDDIERFSTDLNKIVKNSAYLVIGGAGSSGN